MTDSCRDGAVALAFLAALGVLALAYLCMRPRTEGFYFDARAARVAAAEAGDWRGASQIPHGFYPWAPYAHIPPAATSASSLLHLVDLDGKFEHENRPPAGSAAAVNPILWGPPPADVSIASNMDPGPREPRSAARTDRTGTVYLRPSLRPGSRP